MGVFLGCYLRAHTQMHSLLIVSLRLPFFFRDASPSKSVYMVSLSKAPDPKSMSFISPVQRSRRRFSSLMSRWTTPQLWQWRTASNTCRKKLRASSSGKAPFSVMKSNRSLTFSGLSITMMKLSARSNQSRILMTPRKPVPTFFISTISMGTLEPFGCEEIKGF